MWVRLALPRDAGLVVTRHRGRCPLDPRRGAAPGPCWGPAPRPPRVAEARGEESADSKRLNKPTGTHQACVDDKGSSPPQAASSRPDVQALKPRPFKDTDTPLPARPEPRPAWHPCQRPHLRAGVLPARSRPRRHLRLPQVIASGGPRPPRLRSSLDPPHHASHRSRPCGPGRLRCSASSPSAPRYSRASPPAGAAQALSLKRERLAPCPGFLPAPPRRGKLPAGPRFWPPEPHPDLSPGPSHTGAACSRARALHALAPARSAPGGLLPCPTPHSGAVARPPRARQGYPTCSPRQGTRARVP